MPYPAHRCALALSVFVVFWGMLVSTMNDASAQSTPPWTQREEILRIAL